MGVSPRCAQWLRGGVGMTAAQIDIDGHDAPERICACGCKRSLEGMRRNAIYATSACRARDWKRRAGYADPRRRKASRNGKSGRSGLQVSYSKAVEAVVDAISTFSTERLSTGVTRDVREIAAEAVLERLPARQRARLEQ